MIHGARNWTVPIPPPGSLVQSCSPLPNFASFRNPRTISTTRARLPVAPVAGLMKGGPSSFRRLTTMHIVFYEKPGCSNNTRQKALLEAAGHDLDVRNLLVAPWTAEQLRSFFGDRPVAEWFNKAAPQIKSGSVNPQTLNADEAIALMLAEPILIRRPLIEAAGQRRVGFDPAEMEAWVGLQAPRVQGVDLESCRRPEKAAPCPDQPPQKEAHS